MGELEPKPSQSNVTLTLDPLAAALEELRDVEFPCPLCGAGLPIRSSKRKKPYCTCNLCGVQLFVRGKSGIARLHKIVNAGILVSGKNESAAHGITLLNRLEQLKLQREDLKWKRGIIFRDEDVENTILIVDAEIEKVQGELAKLSRAKEKGKKS
jgi:hypothetical protein